MAAAVAVEAEEGHGRPLAEAMDPPADAFLAFAPDRLELDPGGGDIDGAERGEVEALSAAAAVRDEVDFEDAGLRIVPLGEGPNRDLLA